MTEKDLVVLLKNMGKTEMTTGKVPSYARNTNAAGGRSHERGENVSVPIRPDIVAPGATLAILGGVSKEIHKGYKNKWEETYAYGWYWSNEP